MLILFHKEDCQYCAKVRQWLSDHQVSYTSVISPTGSPSRKLLEQFGGQNQVPYLIDTDRGEAMYESGDILTYLEKHHSTH